MPPVPVLHRADIVFAWHQGDLSAAIREGQVTAAHPRIEDIPSHVFGLVDWVPAGLAWDRPGRFGAAFLLPRSEYPAAAATRCVVEAREKGVELNPLLQYVDSEETEVEVWRCTSLSTPDSANVVAFALAFVGHKYGLVADALAFLDNRLFSGRVVLRCLTALGSAVNCSMLWASAYRQASPMCWPSQVDPRGATPADLRSGVIASAAWECVFPRGHMRIATAEPPASRKGVA